MNPPEITVLHRSGLCTIRNFKCNCIECNTSQPEYNSSFCICFVRSGFFGYRIVDRTFEAHVGRVLVSKPDFEHITYHIDGQPDICSVFDFSPAFYALLEDNYMTLNGWFFRNNDVKSVLIATPPGLEYQHRLIINALLRRHQDVLVIDEMVMQLVDAIMGVMGNAVEPLPVRENLKRHHLATAEKATGYIMDHFHENIGLRELADHCCVSPFHFSRIFRETVRQSPYRYLTSVRLTHAKLLLETTDLPVSSIAGQSGFSSLEQFSTSYHRFFDASPTQWRRKRMTGPQKNKRNINTYGQRTFDPLCESLQRSV